MSAPAGSIAASSTSLPRLQFRSPSLTRLILDSQRFPSYRTTCPTPDQQNAVPVARSLSPFQIFIKIVGAPRVSKAIASCVLRNMPRATLIKICWPAADIALNILKDAGNLLKNGLAHILKMGVLKLCDMRLEN